MYLKKDIDIRVYKYTFFLVLCYVLLEITNINFCFAIFPDNEIIDRLTIYCYF